MNITEIQEEAIRLFRAGDLNCAQSLIAAFSDELHFDHDLALKISCGFGGGMGRLQKTCGAVTASFMVLGIVNCEKYSDYKVQKEKTCEMIQQFGKKFESLHGTMECKNLLNCDLNTEEGRRYRADNHLSESVCEKCISDSIGIIQELMER